MCEELIGVWELKDANKDGFDRYMKAVGVGALTRKAAVLTKSTVTICKDKENWTIMTSSTFKNFQIDFKLNLEFDETTGDDRKCKSIVTFENGKLIHVQKWDGMESTIIREVQKDGMITTLIYGDVICTRTYVRKQ